MISQEEISAFFDLVFSWFIQTLPKLLLLIIVFIVIRWLSKKFINRFKTTVLSRVDGKGDQKEKEKRVTTLVGILKGVISVTLWVVFIMIFLKELGLNIAPILAGAGIIGLAVGFGAQELVRDAISGFFLLLENRVRTGDVAIVNGTGGLVESINLRTITLRDLAGIVHTFQNGKIDTLANMTKEWSAMVFDIGVAYKENVDHVIEIIKAVGEDLQADEAYTGKLVDSMEIFGLDKFGDSAVVIKARIKTIPSAQWEIGREFNKRLKVAFDEQGVEIPFPHRTIYWGDAIAPLNLKMQGEK